jgi:hypothetical protein
LTELADRLQAALGQTYTIEREGELYEARGERAKAADYYGRFIDLWKGADPALQAKVAEAKTRLASLAAEPRP